MKLNLAQKHLKASDPVLADLILQYEVLPVSRTSTYFAHLVTAILSQQLSTKVADVIISRFKKLYADKKFPSPVDVLATKPVKLRSAGISYQKISYLKDLAKKFHTKKIVTSRFNKLADEEVIELLVGVKGVGRWTAEMFLIFGLGRPNVFSYGDYGLKKAIQILYKLKSLPTEKQAEKIVSKWHPYKSLGSRYLWASLDNK